MTVYEGYEIFADSAHSDLVCVIKCGSSHFNDRVYVSSLVEAIEAIDNINIYGDLAVYGIALQGMN
jgi:hypothetical protein